MEVGAQIVGELAAVELADHEVLVVCKNLCRGVLYVTALAAGPYSVQVDLGGETFTQNIVKL